MSLGSKRASLPDGVAAESSTPKKARLSNASQNVADSQMYVAFRYWLLEMLTVGDLDSVNAGPLDEECLSRYVSFSVPWCAGLTSDMSQCSFMMAWMDKYMQSKVLQPDALSFTPTQSSIDGKPVTPATLPRIDFDQIELNKGILASKIETRWMSCLVETLLLTVY